MGGCRHWLENEPLFDLSAPAESLAFGRGRRHNLYFEGTFGSGLVCGLHKWVVFGKRAIFIAVQVKWALEMLAYISNYSNKGFSGHDYDKGTFGSGLVCGLHKWLVMVFGKRTIIAVWAKWAFLEMLAYISNYSDKGFIVNDYDKGTVSGLHKWVVMVFGKRTITAVRAKWAFLEILAYISNYSNKGFIGRLFLEMLTTISTNIYNIYKGFIVCDYDYNFLYSCTLVGALQAATHCTIVALV